MLVVSCLAGTVCNAPMSVANALPSTTPNSPSAALTVTLQGSVGGGMASRAVDVDVDGNLAWLGTGLGLTVLDLSDAASPAPIARLDLPGMPYDIVRQGDRAYVALHEAGLAVLDLADPRRPRLTGWVDTPGLAVEVAVTGTVAWVADDDGGLQVLDVADPAHPRITGSLTPTTPTIGRRVVYTVAMRGRRGLMAGAWGVDLLDATDPARPGVIGPVSSGLTKDVAWVSDTVIAITSETEGLVLIDLADEGRPAVLARLDPRSMRLAGLDRVAVQGTVAWVLDGADRDAEGAGLGRVDLSDLTSPRPLGSVGISGSVTDMAIKGSRVLLASPRFGLRQVDWPADGPPRELGVMAVSGSAESVAAHGDYAAVGSVEGGLTMVAATDPARPRGIAALDPTLQTHDVLWLDTLLYVAAGTDGLKILDVADPTRPRQVGVLALAGSAEGLAVAGRYAYVAAAEAGLWVVDVADPAHPRQVGGLDTAGWAWGVTVRDGVAWVADREGGLLTVDVADPARPRLLAHLSDFGYPYTTTIRAVLLAGNVAWLAEETGPGHVFAVDATDPAQPRRLATITVPGPVFGLSAQADRPGRLYVAAGGVGLRVYDVVDPGRPTFLGGIAMPSASAVALAGGRAYVTDAPASGAGALRVLLLDMDVTKSVAGDIGRGATNYIARIATIDTGSSAGGDAPYQAGTYYHLQDQWQADQVAAENGLAMVITGRGWRLVDAADPRHPKQTAADPQLQGLAAAIRAGLAYLIKEGRLEVLDLHDRARPVTVGQLALGQDTPGGILLAWPLAYLYRFTFAEALTALDVADPHRMVALDSAPIVSNGSPRALAALGGRVYGTSSGREYSVSTWRLGDPRHLEFMGLLLPSTVGETLQAGDGLLWGAVENGLQSVDPGDPCAPRVVSRIDLPSTPQVLSLTGGRLWLQLATGELEAWDVTDPLAPRQVGRLRPPGGWAQGLTVNDDRVYVATASAGLLVYKIEHAPSDAVPPAGRAYLPWVASGALVHPPLASEPFELVREPAPNRAGTRLVAVVETPATGRVALQLRPLAGSLVGPPVEIPIPGLLDAEAPSFAPDGNTVLFGGRLAGPDGRAADWEIYRVALDGTGLANLTRAPASDERGPSMADNARYVVFSSNRDGNEEIYRLDLPRYDWLRLTNHPAADREPVYGPDGGLVFVSTRDGNSEIYRLQGGGAVDRLTRDPDEDTHPAFSSDGQRLVWQTLTTCPPDGATAARPGAGVLRVRDLAAGTTATVRQPGADLAWPHFLTSVATGGTLLAGSNASGGWDMAVVEFSN